MRQLNLKKKERERGSCIPIGRGKISQTQQILQTFGSSEIQGSREAKKFKKSKLINGKCIHLFL